MTKPKRPDSDSQAERRFTRNVQRKAQRKIHASREHNRSVWFGLGMFGLVGWAVAIPTLAGIALGWWIDQTWPGPVSWTLTLLFVGVAVGCWNAWYWIGQGNKRE